MFHLPAVKQSTFWILTCLFPDVLPTCLHFFPDKLPFAFPKFQICRVQLDQIEHCHVNTRFSHTLCGQFVTKSPGGSFDCNFCRSSCCEAELVRTFHLKITLADETAKVFAWCTGHTASELLHISPDEFCELLEVFP